MRFLPDGPWIPDALLSARDAGQVLFFCGAGVSRAKANFPDFVRLARQVADELGSAQHSDARRLLEAAKPPADGSKPVATVAIDRVFTLLQQEFEVADVRRAVANALKAPDKCDLSPHRALLELSRIRSGQPRLVTTNFDRLFEKAEEGLQSSAPPRLPDPRRPADFHGIIHLHGAVNLTNDGAEHDEFVLSSGEFGHAYLSDGWATRYIQVLLERFLIVFVGYSADDPPVQYLLEAMNRGATGESRLYAFHAGTAHDAAAQWSHRGVTPIPFDGFDTLWGTLNAWAERARDVDAWHRTIIDRAMGGPAAVTPHERGLVAHLARSADGARALATAETTVPAEWLFVFDRAVRYSTPSRWQPEPDPIDPFDAFGLDDDPMPERVEAQDPFARRNVPGQAWDAFEVATEDRRAASVDAFAKLTGPAASAAGVLPARLSYLGRWLTRVAHQPAAAAWMAGQGSFHPQLRHIISWRLRHQPAQFSEEVREAWMRLMAAETNDPGQARHAIGAEIERAGWSTRLVRSAVALYRPHMAVRKGTTLPWFALSPETSLSALVQAEVEYPRPYAPFTFPRDQLAVVSRLFRAHLELAVQLESELKESGALYLDAIRPLDGERPNEYRLTGLMATFATLVEDLAAADADAAKREVEAWDAYDNAAFTHLRVWASGYSSLMTPGRAAKTLLGVSPNVFWSSEHERDLLLAWRDRWQEWSLAERASLEQRLLQEDLPWFADRDDREDIIAHYRLSRLQWLRQEGVTFSFDQPEVMAQLRVLSPGWEEAAARYTALPRVTRARNVGTDVDDSVLSEVPLSDVVAAAGHLAGYDFDEGTHKNPFLGLARRRPARTFRALILATKHGLDASKAWSTFLNGQAQHPPSSRMRAQIARRLARLPMAATLAIAHPIADWMMSFGQALFEANPAAFVALWQHFLAVLQSERLEPPPAKRDWVNEAINRPAGKLAELLFKDTRLGACQLGSGVPAAWVAWLEALLALPAPQGQYALAVTSLRFTWLSQVGPEWTEQHLLPWSNDNGAGGEAFWAGFLSAGQTPTAAFFTRLKGRLMQRATDGTVRESYRRTVAGMLLIGWRGVDPEHPGVRHVSDADLREVLIHGDDVLRRQALWQLGHWAQDEQGEWNTQVLPFLRNVWPLQRAVKTGASSAALLNLAFVIPEGIFDEVAKAIEPRLTVVNSSAMLGPLDGEALDAFAKSHAPALLTLLWNVLSEDAGAWPYEASAYLASLGRQPSLAGDARLTELLRRQHQAGPI